MSDHYLKADGHQNMAEEMDYRYGKHFGRHATLSDRQFEESYEPDEHTPYVEVDEGSLNY